MAAIVDEDIIAYYSSMLLAEDQVAYNTCMNKKLVSLEGYKDKYIVHHLVGTDLSGRRKVYLIVETAVIPKIEKKHGRPIEVVNV